MIHIPLPLQPLYPHASKRDLLEEGQGDLFSATQLRQILGNTESKKEKVRKKLDCLIGARGSFFQGRVFNGKLCSSFDIYENRIKNYEGRKKTTKTLNSIIGSSTAHSELFIKVMLVCAIREHVHICFYQFESYHRDTIHQKL